MCTDVVRNQTYVQTLADCLQNRKLKVDLEPHFSARSSRKATTNNWLSLEWAQVAIETIVCNDFHFKLQVSTNKYNPSDYHLDSYFNAESSSQSNVSRNFFLFLLFSCFLLR